ncbi:MAG: hypothetical protein KDA51_19665, partial [Planctomycetales bacterium]|nr:hypothetical protein [Planctomycetales bacterium]
MPSVAFLFQPQNTAARGSDLLNDPDDVLPGYEHLRDFKIEAPAQSTSGPEVTSPEQPQNDEPGNEPIAEPPSLEQDEPSDALAEPEPPLSSAEPQPVEQPPLKPAKVRPAPRSFFDRPGETTAPQLTPPKPAEVEPAAPATKRPPSEQPESPSIFPEPPLPPAQSPQVTPGLTPERTEPRSIFDRSRETTRPPLDVPKPTDRPTLLDSQPQAPGRSRFDSVPMRRAEPSHDTEDSYSKPVSRPPTETPQAPADSLIGDEDVLPGFQYLRSRSLPSKNEPSAASPNSPG